MENLFLRDYCLSFCFLGRSRNHNGIHCSKNLVFLLFVNYWFLIKWSYNFASWKFSRYFFSSQKLVDFINLFGKIKIFDFSFIKNQFYLTIWSCEKFRAKAHFSSCSDNANPVIKAVFVAVANHFSFTNSFSI